MNLRDVPNLDFIRSVAVLSVVLEHTLLALHVRQLGPFPIPYLGVLGVLVFFVLTSLVLMWSLERKPHTLDFYIRRFFRIYPLAWVAMALVLLFRAPTGGTPYDFFQYAHPSLKQVAIQATIIHPTSATMLGVMWSLPYEVEMYLLLPMLFFFVRKNFAVWPLLLAWVLIPLNTHNVPKTDTNFAVAMGYFLPGVMAYVGFGRWKPRLPAWTLPVFLTLMWVFFLYKCDFHKGWLFCLIVGLSLPLFRQFESKIVLEPSRIIAKYSYGVYLMHPFAIVIGLYLLKGYSWPVRAIGEVVPLIVLPVVGYHLIEHPMIRLGSLVAARAEKKYEQFELKHFRRQPHAQRNASS